MLLIFPGIWLIVVAALCLTNAGAVVSLIVSVIAGLGSYIFWVTTIGATKNDARAVYAHALVILGIFVASALVVIVYKWITWDSFVSTGAAGWGWDICKKYELRDVQNTSGREATSRMMQCPGLLAGDISTTYYVFVHDVHGRNSSRNVVLEYDATGSMLRQPKVEWVNDSLLKISEDDEIAGIKKQRKGIDGINIIYQLPGST